MEIVLIIMLFVLGTVMGSFGLVLLDRWENLSSVWTGRSKCDHCHNTLKARDLVPVISYRYYGGKCRMCHTPIPVSCVMMEITMGVVRAITTAVIVTQSDYQTIVFRCIINWALVLLSVHDHRSHYLHWPLWIIAVVTSLGYTWMIKPDLWHDAMMSAGVLGLVFLGIYGSGYMIHWVKYRTRQEGFGFGDVMMAVVLGRLWVLATGGLAEDMLINIQLILGYLVVASTCGLIYWGRLRHHDHKEVEIAFIPAMVIGFWVMLGVVKVMGMM